MANDGSVEIKIVGDDSDLKKKLSSVGSAAQSAAKIATAAIAGIGTAFIGVGAYAVKVGSDFEAAMSKVQAISGATSADMEQLTAKAKEMGATTKFSATESAEALQYMAQAGWQTQQMIDGLPGIMNLAAASGENLASVSDIVTDALTAFGLKASDSAHFADVLAKASAASNTDVAKMGATFKYVAPIAGAMGYNIEDAAVAVGLMANAGIKGEQAGTSLRAMFTRLANPPKDAAAAIETLGIKMTDAAGQMLPLSNVLGQMREKFAGLTQEQKVQMASSLAGQEAMSGLLAIVNASTSDYNNLTDAIAHADGAAKSQADTMNDNLKGALTLLGSNLEGVGIQIYDSLEQPLKQAVQVTNDSVTRISRSLSSGDLKASMQTISTATGKAVTALSNFAAQAIPKAIKAVADLIQNGNRLIAVLKPLAVAFLALKATSAASAALGVFHTTSLKVAAAVATETAALTTNQLVVGVLTGKIGLATAAQAAWNAAMTANPIGTVVLAVGALTAGIALLVAASEKEVTETDRIIAKNDELHAKHEEWLSQQQMIADARNDAIALSNTESAQLDGYIASLKNCVDENGKVKAGYEDRAAYLTEQINSIIPGAIEMNQKEADSYITICDNIDQLIAQKKKEAMMNAYQTDYEEALKGVTAAQAETTAREQEAANAKSNLVQKQNEYNAALAKYNDEQSRTGANTDATNQAMGEADKALRDAQAAYDSCSQSVANARTESDKYLNTIAAVNALDIASKPEEINAAVAALNTGMITASEAGADQIKQQFDSFIQVRDDAIAKLNDPSLPEAERMMWEQIAREAQSGAGNLSQEYEKAGGTVTDAMIQGLSNGAESVREATEGAGREAADGYAAGIASAAGDAQQNAANVKSMCEAALKGDTSAYGEDFTRGYLLGILALNPTEEVRAMVQAALNTIAETQDSHSPSALTMEQGGYFAEGYAEGISDGAGASETAAGSMAQQAIAKLLGIAPQAQQGGTNAANSFAGGISSAAGSAVTAAGKAATDAASAASAKTSEFSAAGGALSTSLATSMGSQQMLAASRNAMTTVANGALSAAKATSNSFVDVGVNMAQGLMSGISQMAQRVATSAANLAKSALQAAKDAVNIKSPSRDFRDQVGRMMAAGMAIGIENGKGQVKASVAMLSRAAFEDARDNAKDFKEIGDLYVSNLTYGVEKGRDAALDQFERWIDADVEKFKARKDATDEQKKSYEDAANEVMTAYKSALNDGYDEALDTVKTRVSELTAEFKSQHDALIREQESMQNKLSGFGDLFTIGKDGSLALEDINKNIDAVKRYDDALTALKERGVSDEFMQQVTGLGVEEGTKFAEKLTKLPDDAFDSYTAAWQEQQDLAKAVAEKFYQDQLETLETEFSGKLDETLESVPTLLTGIGQDSIQGMIKGMESQAGPLADAAREIVKQAISAMRMAADIHSPSRKTRELVGKPLAEGIAVGFDKQMSDVYRQISQTLDGEVMKLSADVKVQAERQAAQNSPAPVQTVFKSTHTVATPVIEFKGELAQLGRFITPVVRMEEKRIGGNMVKGEA